MPGWSRFEWPRIGGSRVDHDRMRDLQLFLDDFWRGPLALLKALAEARVQAEAESPNTTI